MSAIVGAVAESVFRTDTADSWTDKREGPIQNPRGAAGNPEDILTATLFLASPASVNVTGTIVRRDGGTH